jgi:hypothetical protein
MRTARAWTLLVCLGLSVACTLSLGAQYIYIANTGDATVSKININTNQVVATYPTWFGPTGSPLPSRIAVDAGGNVFVLNRFLVSNHKPVLLKILPSGGTLTSTGPSPLPLVDAPPLGRLDPAEIAAPTADDRLAWAQEVGDVAGWGRALCFDLKGNLWVGMNNTNRYYRFDPNAPTPPTATPTAMVLTPGHTPYGCVVDSNGILYSASSGPAPTTGRNVARIDTKPQTPVFLGLLDHFTGGFGRNYGISQLNGCGVQSRIYFSNWLVSGKPYIELDPGTNTFKNPVATISPAAISYAVAVDLQGNIVSGMVDGRIIKYNQAGNVIWNTATLGTTVAMPDLHGLIIDENNNIWAIDRNNDQVVKYRSNGSYEATVKVGDQPYTYANASPPNCPCGAIREPRITCERDINGVGTYAWGFTFINQGPFGTPATAVEFTSTNSNVTLLTPPSPYPLMPPVGGGGQATINGTFSVNNGKPGDAVCFDIRLTGGSGPESWCCPGQRVCFTLPECPRCAKITAKVECAADGKRHVSLTVTNGGPSPVQSLQVFSTTPGVTVNPSTLQVTLPPNTPVTLPPLTITGGSAGQIIGITVNIHGPIDPNTGAYSWCCTATIEVRLPDCGIIVNPPNT